MKIAYFLTEFPVISETFVLNQITGLLDLGHDVDVLVLRYGDTSVVHSDVEKYQLLNKIHLTGDSYELMPRNKLQRLAKAAGIFTRASLSDKRVLLRCLNVVVHGGEAWKLTLFYRAWRMLELGEQYDVFHCHFGHNGSRAAALKMVGAIRAPVVTTFHGHDITQDLLIRGRDTYQQLFTHGTLFLPVSRLWQQELLKLGCAEEKIQVHRMGIAVEEFAVNQHAEQPICTLLTVARLVEKKGVSYAIAAMEKVLSKVSGLRYQIVGSGPLETALKQQISDAGLQDQVQMLGWKNQQEIDELVAETDIFVLPSVTASSGDKEGVPVVLMEAMARAIPVVSTLHSGIPELVDSGKSGYLVAERDTDGLAESIISLIQNPELRERMGEAGRDKVLSEFNIRTLNEQLAAKFAKLAR